MFVPQFFKLILVFLLELALLEMEVLFLSFDNNCQLRFFRLCLFYKSLQLSNLLEVFYFLVRNFLVQVILLLLAPYFIHQFILVCIDSEGISSTDCVEMWLASH